MDTKWKKWTGRAGYLLFAVGISLILYHGTWFLRESWYLGEAPGEIVRSVKESFQEDYQQTGQFRRYMEGTLEQFLVMATNGNVYDFYGWGFYNSGYRLLSGTSVSEAFVTDTASAELTMESQVDEEMAAEYGSGEAEYWEGGEREEGMDKDSLTEEQKKARAQKIHNRRKEDKNLLYAIYYDGELLYANTEDLKLTDGELTAPEGYNFLMCFDDGRVTITKDGQELDIYGDGYYREDTSEWYVPGYRNFTVDEDTKKAQILMAAAKETLLYTVSRSESDGYSQYYNQLYWIQRNLRENKTAYRFHALWMLGGLLLLLAACFLRKGKKRTDQEIADFTGRLWLELKLLLCGAVLCSSVVYTLLSGAAAVIDELYYEYSFYESNYSGLLGSALGSAVRGISPVSWVLCFWAIYLAAMDIRYHKQVWKKSLGYLLYCRFSAKGSKHPLAKRMLHRNALILILVLAYGILNIGGLWGISYVHGYEAVWQQLLFAVGGLILLTAVLYLVGGKNADAAKDLDVMARRIQQIHDGDYNEPEKTMQQDSDGREKEAPFTGNVEDRDLGLTMRQVEDIRQGMSSAVEEQMKSERMKVELIANVSHDIKTPLTSIISYVQFLKQEEALPEHVKDYIRILDEKSQRLKSMVQDVFAVSKAASGELPVKMEELDFGRLLCQTMADMEEQISHSSVTFKTDIPAEPVMILADGQRMYRVFQNLFQNAMKYSLDGSRVYVTLQTAPGGEGGSRFATASVKNTSRMEIDQDMDYAERFTRGDMSRSDGGSGLGLSIAQSFTEACGGSFLLETIADLFVVTISFKIL